MARLASHDTAYPARSQEYGDRRDSPILRSGRIVRSGGIAALNRYSRYGRHGFFAFVATFWGEA